jgi:hypothetical protein
MNQYVNPFTGSQIKITKFFLEDEVDLQSLKNSNQIEDENERFILFYDGTLVKKTLSEKKYFPNKA